ncbi:uncharacterized protein ACOB8E_015458 isoform 1-T1 [Sarcophilus harrisii]
MRSTSNTCVSKGCFATSTDVMIHSCGGSQRIDLPLHPGLLKKLISGDFRKAWRGLHEVILSEVSGTKKHCTQQQKKYMIINCGGHDFTSKVIQTNSKGFVMERTICTQRQTMGTECRS